MTSELMSEVLALDVVAFTRITVSFDTVNRFAARFGSMFLDAMTKDYPDGTGINDMSALGLETLEALVERASVKHVITRPTQDLLDNEPKNTAISVDAMGMSL
mmetsp:Transcript_4375/g.8836  ORF Transcript_4375/g.8836 Transcript_4375/m.8836 type:complete len:103 (+) Transcript_4375:575-883(+)